MKNIHEILKEYWGFDHFRPFQQEIIESVLENKDVLAILPTGGGKSLCFQVPAMARPGICLVISPLIALMKDQVANLKKKGIPALLIHSGMDKADVIRTLKNASHDYFKFLYVSPERLESFLFKEYLPSLLINLIAVDEAHCISQWGYDFRPSYLKITELRKELPGVPVIALTASATEEVQKDICFQLSFENQHVFLAPYARKNLAYKVIKTDSKFNELIDTVKNIDGSGIIYCKTRRRTQEIASLLQLHKLKANFYHAGLPSDDRNKRQQDWINNETRIIVCTNAFGMGIDKPDVRFVLHADVPDCLENYYQEAGRAGRDGKDAFAILLYNDKEMDELAEQYKIRFPSLKRIRTIYHSLVNFLQIPAYTGENIPFIFQIDVFIQNFKLNIFECLYALKALEQDGWFDYNEQNFSPSTIVFQTSKKGLYEFYQTYPSHELLLTTLLRTYEGIFDFPTFISEKLIAKLLRKNESDIKNELIRISNLKIIDYKIRSDAPQIIFRKNRIPSEDLRINTTLYDKRKKAFIERVNNIINYTHSQGCRSVFINNYFGDKSKAPCGICDQCVNHSKETNLSNEEFKHIFKLVESLLYSKERSIKELIEEMPQINSENLWKVLMFLIAENKLKEKENGILQLK